MRHSLTIKLTLTFLLVAITATGLMTVVFRQSSPERVNQFLFEKDREQLKADLIGYYVQAGSLAGFTTRTGGISVMTPGPPPTRLPGQNPPPEFWQPDIRPPRFGVIDARGMILSSPDPQLQSGQKASEELIARSEPVFLNGEKLGYLFTQPEPPKFSQPEQDFLKRNDQALLLAALGAVLVAVVVGIVLARTLTLPLQALTQAANRISGGDLEQTVPVHSQDEIGELGRAFNQMSQAVAQANRLRQRMTADIAHDLRTPLTVIAGYIEAIRAGDMEPSQERLNIIYAEIEHLQHLVADLRILSQTDAGELKLFCQSIHPYNLLQQAATTYQHRAEQEDITLQVEVGPDLPLIQVDEVRMAQVLSNLLDNALRYTPSGGQIRLSACQENDRVLITIQDTGSGILPQDLPWVFNRLYRADKSRSGSHGESGLGLAIVKALVELHGGTVQIDSRPGSGTTVAIYLPHSSA